MFREAKSGPQKALTANRLSDGLVVFLADKGVWSLSIGDARLVAEGAELDEVLAYGKAQQAARIIVDSYAIDVEVVDGKPLAARLRERIRSQGPTIPYGEAEMANWCGLAG